jgi:hypothetical protein
VHIFEFEHLLLCHILVSNFSFLACSLVDSEEVSNSEWDGSATSECYIFVYPLALAVIDKDGLDGDTWSCQNS